MSRQNRVGVSLFCRRDIGEDLRPPSITEGQIEVAGEELLLAHPHQPGDVFRTGASRRNRIESRCNVRAGQFGDAVVTVPAGARALVRRAGGEPDDSEYQHREHDAVTDPVHDDSVPANSWNAANARGP